jgi:transcription antitermination factor NusG
MLKDAALRKIPGEPGPAWYVVHTRSRHEVTVEAGLEARGVEVFLPRITRRSRRRDRFRLLKAPLFPGYLFVNADLATSSYHDIIKQHGVVRILGPKGQCSPVPGETVISLKTVLASGRSYDPWLKLATGGRVAIVDGPLTGAVGIILRKKDGSRRLMVAVDLLGRSVAVDLAEEMVTSYP